MEKKKKKGGGNDLTKIPSILTEIFQRIIKMNDGGQIQNYLF